MAPIPSQRRGKEGAPTVLLQVQRKGGPSALGLKRSRIRLAARRARVRGLKFIRHYYYFRTHLWFLQSSAQTVCNIVKRV